MLSTTHSVTSHKVPIPDSFRRGYKQAAKAEINKHFPLVNEKTHEEFTSKIMSDEVALAKHFQRYLLSTQKENQNPNTTSLEAKE